MFPKAPSFLCSCPSGTQGGKRFVLLHVVSEICSSVFPITEKKSENPAASPGEKPSPCVAGASVCVWEERWGGRSAGGVEQLCVKVIPLRWLLQSELVNRLKYDCLALYSWVTFQSSYISCALHRAGMSQGLRARTRCGETQFAPRDTSCVHHPD